MTIFGTSNPRDMLSEGDTVLVRVTNVEAENRRIALSIDKVTVEEQEDWLHSRREDAPNYTAEIAVEGAASQASIEEDMPEDVIDNLDESVIPAATE